MPTVPETNARAESAKKLGVSKYLSEIDKYPMPQGQASSNATGNIAPGSGKDSAPLSGDLPDYIPEPTPAAPSAVPPHPDYNDYDKIIDGVDGNPYDRMIAEDRKTQKSQLQASMFAGTATAPDQAAKVRQLSNDTNIPEEIVARNFETISRKKAVEHNDYDSLIDNTPELAKWLEEPKNSSVAHDDLDNLKEHANLVNQAVIADDLHSSFRAGYQNSLYGLMYRQKAPETVLGPDATRLQKFVSGAATLAGDIPFMIAGGLAGGVGGTAVAGPAGAFVGSAAGGFGAPAALKKGIIEHLHKGDIKDTADLLERSKLILKEFGKQTAVGLAVQATGGATGWLAQSAKLGATATAGAKIATEAGSLEVAGKAVEGETPSIEGYIDNLFLISAMHGMGAIATAHTPAELSQAERTKAFYQALGETAKDSKLLKRLPEAHRDLVQSLTKDGPVENIYIPLEAATSYFQGKGLPIEGVAQELGIGKQLEEARLTGGDLKIPLSTWVEKVVHTEHYAGLAEDVKFSPEALTSRQSVEVQKDWAERVKKMETEATGNPSPEATAVKESAAAVHEEFKQKLIQAGETKEAATLKAKVFESFFATEAENRNKDLPPEQHVTPEQVASEFNINVRAFDNVAARDAHDLAQAQEMRMTSDTQEGQALLREVSQGAKKDRLALARKALENIPDVSADAVAEAFGLQPLEVRKLSWKGRRKGKAVETNYSRDEIHRAAGVDKSFNAGSMDQGPARREVRNLPEQTDFPMEDSGKVTVSNLDKIESVGPRPGSATNSQTGWNIDIPSKADNHAGAHVKNDAGSKAIDHLDELVKNAVYFYKEKYVNKEGKADRNIPWTHHFYVPFEANGKLAIARLVVNETQMGKKLYHSLVVEKEGAPPPLGSEVPEGTGQTRYKEPLPDSIAKLKAEINTARETKSYFQGAATKQISATAKALKAELEKSLGKDLGLEISDGAYEREVEHSYDASYPVEGAQRKRAVKLGFDTEHAWFHGTRADIESFSGDTLGGSTGAGSARLAHFFASSPETASDYARASNDALSLRSSRTEAEATRAKENFTARMREKHGSKWVSKLDAKEKAERASIEKQFAQSKEDFERSQQAQEHKIKFREYEIQQAENNVKFLEGTLKRKDFEKKNKENQAYADKLKTLLDNTEFVKTDRGYEVVKKDTGEKIPNIHGSAFESSKFNHYDSEERVRDKIEKIEQRISENSRENLKEQLVEAKNVVAEMKADHLKNLQGTEGQTVYKTVLKTQNPLIVDFKGAGYREVTYREIIERAQSHGYDSVIFKNTFDPAFIGSMAAEPELIDVAAVFEPSQIRSVQAKFDPKMADSPNILSQGDESNPRGQLSFKGKDFNLDLFKGRDISTSLHEINHFLFEAMGHMVEGEGKGSKEVQKSYATILKWLGVTDRSEIKVDHHEKLARALEKYYQTGEAPSVELRSAFKQFKKWLSDLWKKIQFDDVQVSPELKQAFDSMFATERQIDEAKRSLNMADEFPHDLLDPADSERIKKLQEEARDHAESILLKDRLEKTKADYKKKLAEETAKFREAAEAQVKAEPVFAAIEGLRETGKKVNPYDLAEKALAGELTPEQSTQFELLADEHGFLTAEQMALEISNAGLSNAFETKVKAMVNEGLKQAGLIKDAAQLREDAIRAIHSEQMTELLSLEREALTELANKAVISDEVRKRNRVLAKAEAQAASAEAKRILEAKPADEAAKTTLYITQERNAAARASKFLAKKDYEKSSQAKKEQMVAHALVRESFKINEEVSKHEKYVEQFTNRRGSLLDMPYGFVRQLDGLLDRFGFQTAPKEDAATNQKIAAKMEADGAEPHEIANATGFVSYNASAWVPETLPGFIDRQNDNYHAIQIAPSVLQAVKVERAEMTIGELRDFREAVQIVVESGRKNDRFLNEFIKIDAKQAAKELRTSIEGKVGTPHADDFKIGTGDEHGFKAKIKALLNLPDAVIPSMVNMDSLVKFLDRGDPNGPVRRYLYRPMAEAENRKQVRHEQAVKEVNEILAKHYTQVELASYKTEKRLAIKGFREALTKENVLSMALNWGNETNRDRVTRGYKIDEGMVNDAFDILDKRDWDFVQDVWNYLDTYWPEIKALEMKVKGVEPHKVKASKVVTKHGVYEGGYYPIAFDFMKSADAFQMSEQRSELYKQFSAVAAHTERGHAEARVTRVTRPVRLSLGVMFDHLENVVHDLSYREAVIDVNRMLRDHDVKTGIQNAVGIKGYTMTSQWLKDLASDQRNSLQDGEQLLRWFRGKATLSTLALKLSNLPMDLTGNVINVVHEIGPTRMMRAIGDHAFSRGETNEFIEEKSTYMRAREKTLDRDISDLSRRWQQDKPLLDRAASKVMGKDVGLAHFAFFFQRYADAAIAKPLWKEVYRESLGKYSEEESVHIADETVKRTLGSGSPIDLVGVQKGSEAKKILTMYYSWSSMMFNRAWSEGKIAGLEYREGNYLPAVAIAAKATFFLWALHATNENFWRELMYNAKNGKVDGDDRKKRIAGRYMQQPFSYVWLGRDIAGYAIDKATGQHGNMRLSPVESAMEAVLTPVATGIHHAFVDPKKFDGKFLEDSAKAASIIMGSPQQLNNMAFNFIDWANNNGHATWQDALQRRHKK